ncbi:hypothetical protein VTJ83DRAFT_5212 [Remersonia thermophila]|uniref:Archaemetzincin-2 n=1 Tax=Remersonia thermophila TaxID=72144 RepID=A0ABR4DC74_9PEZI
MSSCNHPSLRLDVSPHAAATGFSRPALARRQAATTPSGRVTNKQDVLQNHARLESLFPAPLVLPGDALAVDPGASPPQSLRSWVQDKNRNPVTPQRKTIYVAPTPSFAPELGPAYPLEWQPPAIKLPGVDKGVGRACFDARSVRDYLEAFYHPLPVKMLPGEVRWVPWSEDGGRRRGPKDGRYLGLQIGDGVTRIAVRRCPDEAYRHQLRVGDLLDALADALPRDAYALLLVTEADMYEDDEDEFCCGRAYGGSRVAVVSGARYHPVFDAARGGREHDWPFSHCAEFVGSLCEGDGTGSSSGERGDRSSSKGRKTDGEALLSGSGADAVMEAVVQAGLNLPAPSPLQDRSTPRPDPGAPSSLLWLSRVARTAAHEVGHCFCLEHCSYYACIMQDTSGMSEDLRQPPYLCLVCLAKLERAVLDGVSGSPADDGAAFCIARYEALVRLCARWEHAAPMWAAYRRWLETRIEMLKNP